MKPRRRWLPGAGLQRSAAAIYSPVLMVALCGPALATTPQDQPPEPPSAAAPSAAAQDTNGAAIRQRYAGASGVQQNGVAAVGGQATLNKPVTIVLSNAPTSRWVQALSASANVRLRLDGRIGPGTLQPLTVVAYNTPFSTLLTQIAQAERLGIRRDQVGDGLVLFMLPPPAVPTLGYGAYAQAFAAPLGQTVDVNPGDSAGGAADNPGAPPRGSTPAAGAAAASQPRSATAPGGGPSPAAPSSPPTPAVTAPAPASPTAAGGSGAPAPPQQPALSPAPARGMNNYNLSTHAAIPPVVVVVQTPTQVEAANDTDGAMPQARLPQAEAPGGGGGAGSAGGGYGGMSGGGGFGMATNGVYGGGYAGTANGVDNSALARTLLQYVLVFARSPRPLALPEVAYPQLRTTDGSLLYLAVVVEALTEIPAAPNGASSEPVTRLRRLLSDAETIHRQACEREEFQTEIGILQKRLNQVPPPPPATRAILLEILSQRQQEYAAIGR